MLTLSPHRRVYKDDLRGDQPILGSICQLFLCSVVPDTDDLGKQSCPSMICTPSFHFGETEAQGVNLSKVKQLLTDNFQVLQLTCPVLTPRQSQPDTSLLQL